MGLFGYSLGSPLLVPARQEVAMVRRSLNLSVWVNMILYNRGPAAVTIGLVGKM